MPQNSGGAVIGPIVLILCAITLAALGTILPGMMELEPPIGSRLRATLYVAALFDFLLALWMWGKLKKAAARSATGGTIQRQ